MVFRLLFLASDEILQAVAVVAGHNEVAVLTRSVHLAVVVVPAAKLSVTSQNIAVGSHRAVETSQVVQALLARKLATAEIHAVDINHLEVAATRFVDFPLRVAVVEIPMLHPFAMQVGDEGGHALQNGQCMRCGEGVGHLRDGLEVRIAGDEVGIPNDTPSVILAPADGFGGRNLQTAQLGGVFEGASSLALAQVTVGEGVDSRRFAKAFNGDSLACHLERTDGVATLKNQFALLEAVGQLLDERAKSLHGGVDVALHRCKDKEKDRLFGQSSSFFSGR